MAIFLLVSYDFPKYLPFRLLGLRCFSYLFIGQIQPLSLVLAGLQQPPQVQSMPDRQNLEILGKCGFGVWGVCRAIFIVIVFEKRMAQKLCIIILLHFGFVTFRVHFGRTRKPIIFMVFGLMDVSMTFKNSYLSALRAEPATVLLILVVADKWGNSKINQQ